MASNAPVETSEARPTARWPMWLVTLGGAGLLRPAPGTWGSAAMTLSLVALRALDGGQHFQQELGIGVLLLGIINVWFGKFIVRYFGREDPGQCVIDEGAGICLTMLGLPMQHPAIAFIAAFAAFRLFDIIKLPPARQLENLPLGWGILLDDLAAAVYANLLCQVLLRLL